MIASDLSKGDRIMEIHAEGTYFQEGDHVCIKRTRETGRVSATDGGLVYVRRDQTHEIRLFSALVQEDVFIEFIAPEAEGTRGEGG
jgi:hypothetical protein